MRLILHLLLICVIAVGIGLGLTWLAVRNPPALNVIADGPWTAIANEGSPDVDAYALAALSHRGEAPISIADGLTFRALKDSEGQMLSGACSYRVSGVIPSVRVWSLAAFDEQGLLFPNPAQRYGYTSLSVTRDSENAVQIGLSADALPGDWIPVSRERPFMIALRLYDTTAAAISGGRSAPELPDIKRIGCGS